MPKSGLPVGLFLCVVVCVTPSLVAAVPQIPSRTLTAVSDSSVESVEKLAAKAAVAFRAGQFETSLDLYRRADLLVTRPEEHAALRMNMGACWLELSRLSEAKVVFLSAAELDPEVAKKARLNAAFVAVEMDRLDEAESLLAAVAPVDDALLSRESDLRARIAVKRRQRRRIVLLQHMDVAAAAIGKQDWRVAESALIAAKGQFAQAELSEQVDVLHGLATVQLALKRPRDALVTLRAALQLAPNDPEVHYALGRAHEALDADAEARREYRAAIVLGLKEPQAVVARQKIEALDPLSSSEWFGWLALGGGYDSNPLQSGLATETTVAQRGHGGSVYGRTAAEFGATQRVHDQLSLRLRYVGDVLLLEKQTARALSMQNHGIFASAHYAPTDRLTLSLELGPSITYIGVSPISPFLRDLSGSAKARYRASTVRTWRFTLEARTIAGASGWEYLGGTRLDTELTHGWHFRPIDFRLGVRARLLSIGTRGLLVDATVMPACINLCAGSRYVIPLSYAGFGPIASTRIALTESLHLAGSAQFDWRRYLGDSYIQGVPLSLKRRQDLRYNFGAELEWALDKHEHFLIVPSYALLISASNVAQSNADWTHRFDYDDRSFVQHFAELAFEASF